MLDGLRHLRQAAVVLTYIDDDAPSREVLAKALRELWLASADWGRWPANVREDAERMVSLAFRHGAIRHTTQQMTDEEVREAIGSIRRLAAEADGVAEPA